MSSVFIKIVAMVIIGAVLVVSLKANGTEMGFLLLLAVSVAVAILIIESFYPSFKSQIEIYENSTGNKSVLSVVIKALVISYIAEFCSNTCLDFGLSSLASKAELAGKCAVLTLSVPLINSIIKTALELTEI